MLENYYLWGGVTPAPTVIFPEQLRRGDSWEFNLFSPDYAGENAENGPWTGTAIFANGTEEINQVATIDDQTFYWVILPADTEQMSPGPAQYVIQVTNATLRRTLQSGSVQIVDDISDPTNPVQTQTMLQQQLAAADQCLLDLLGQRVAATSFGGKTYTLLNIKDLWAIRNGIAQRAAAEAEEAAGNTRHRCIVPMFINL